MSILDEPMFPQEHGHWQEAHDKDTVDRVFVGQPGKSARVYAAIHLCMPESGDAELDAMIRKAQRQRLAGMALARMASSPHFGGTQEEVARWACRMTDTLLAELEKP